jgi:hypothetical protein
MMDKSELKPRHGERVTLSTPDVSANTTQQSESILEKKDKIQNSEPTDVITDNMQQSKSTTTLAYNRPEAESKNAALNFNFLIAGEVFYSFMPVSASTSRLGGDWCNHLYGKFHERFPSCALTFNGNRLRLATSRKNNARACYGSAVSKVKKLHFSFI